MGYASVKWVMHLGNGSRAYSRFMHLWPSCAFVKWVLHTRNGSFYLWNRSCTDETGQTQVKWAVHLLNGRESMWNGYSTYKAVMHYYTYMFECGWFNESSVLHETSRYGTNWYVSLCICFFVCFFFLFFFFLFFVFFLCVFFFFFVISDMHTCGSLLYLLLMSQSQMSVKNGDFSGHLRPLGSGLCPWE